MIEAMPGWDRIYSDEQREAVAVAYIDQRIRPAHRVVALAKAGNLHHGDRKLPAFDIAENTVRSYGAQLVKSRKGQLKSGLTDQEPRDALETIRKRLQVDARNLPAVALTAFTRPQDQARALDKGFQKHLAKPVQVGRLIGAIRQLTGRNAGRQRAARRHLTS